MIGRWSLRGQGLKNDCKLDLNIKNCLAREKEKITELCIHYTPKLIMFAFFHLLKSTVTRRFSLEMALLDHKIGNKRRFLSPYWTCAILKNVHNAVCKNSPVFEIDHVSATQHLKQLSAEAWIHLHSIPSILGIQTSDPAVTTSPLSPFRLSTTRSSTENNARDSRGYKHIKYFTWL